MKRSKKIFLIVGLLFIVGVIIITVDIFTKTSLPGSKKYLKESILPSQDNEDEKTDTTAVQAPGDKK